MPDSAPPPDRSPKQDFTAGEAKAPPADPNLKPSEPHVWQRRWFQTLLAVLVVFLVMSYVLPGVLNLLYAVRAILVPVLIGLALAYICNPLLRFAERRLKIGRLTGTISLMLMALVVVAVIVVQAIPLLYNQTLALVNTIQSTYPQYVDRLMEQIEAQTRRPAETVAETGAGNGKTVEQDEAEAAPQGEAIEPLEPIVEVAKQAIEESVSGKPLTEEQPKDPEEIVEDEIAPGNREKIAEAPTEPPGETAITATEPLTANGEPQDEGPSSFFTRMMERERNRRLVEAGVKKMRSLDWSLIATWLVQSLDIGVGLVGTAIGLTSYFALASVVIAFCFFFFAWKMDDIFDWFEPYIPESSREKTCNVFCKMDAAVSSFVRGRVIQSLVMMGLLTVGWLIVGVPYWFLLGLITGVLNLVPFLPAVGWLMALLLTVMSQLSAGGSFEIGLIIWPSVVYFVAQGLDGWVVEPWVQGKATNLDPLTVLLAVLIGGSLLGLVGMLLAIPLTACVKILMREIFLPKLKRLSNPHRPH